MGSGRPGWVRRAGWRGRPSTVADSPAGTDGHPVVDPIRAASRGAYPAATRWSGAGRRALATARWRAAALATAPARAALAVRDVEHAHACTPPRACRRRVVRGGGG